jgi:hypothetical protein
MFKWGLCPLQPALPCIRAHASSSGSNTVVRITGGNFGSGNAPTGTSVWFLPFDAQRRANASASMAIGDRTGVLQKYLDGQLRDAGARAVPCTPVKGTSVWVNSSVLECALAGPPLRRGQWDVLVFAAFSAALSSPYGITPLAACGCGRYSERDGDLCLPCPPGASCAGALDKARPLAGVWETSASQWTAERSLPLAALSTDRSSYKYEDPRWIYLRKNWGVPRFVPCAEESLCRPNQQCLPGSSGWMCLTCPPTFIRSTSGQCTQCLPEQERNFWVSAAAAVVLVLLGYYQGRALLEQAGALLGQAWRGACGLLQGAEERRRAAAAAAEAEAAARVAAAAAAAAADEAGSSSAQGSYRKVPYIKVLLSYFQTLAALSSYASLRPDVGGDGLVNRIKDIVPPVLLAFRPLQDLGTSYDAIKCALAMSTPTAIKMQLLFPLLMDLLAYFGFYAASYLKEFLGRLQRRVSAR